MAKHRQNYNPQDKEESLRLITDEQRQDYGYILHIYDRLRATESFLLTAAFGVIAYLYYPVGDCICHKDNCSLAQQFFFPNEHYGQIIYLVAIAFFVYSVVKLMLNVFSENPWVTAYESTKTDYKYTCLDTLIYIKKRYDTCNKANTNTCIKRKRELKFLFFCIVISATILVIIKSLN